MATRRRSGIRHPILDVRDMTWVSDGTDGSRALRDINFRVERGEQVAVTGPSEADLLDLLCVIVGLDTPDEGQCRLDGVDLAECGAEESAEIRSRAIGLVYRTINLVPMSVLANVELPLVHAGVGPAERRQRALAALDEVGLADRAGADPGELSDGEQQRVAVARALVGPPALLLADDPTADLDERGAAEVLDLFDRLNAQGLTIVVLTPDRRVAARADRQIVLCGGRIADDTSIPALAS